MPSTAEPSFHDPRAQDDDVVRMLERAGSIGVWRLDLQEPRLVWSDQLATLHGAPPGYAPPADDPLRHYSPGCKSSLESLLQACATEGTPFDEEAQIVLLDGRRAWVRCSASRCATDRPMLRVRGRGAGDRAARPRAGHPAAPPSAGGA